MTSDREPRLRLVTSDLDPDRTDTGARDIDWTILMARAQDGDKAAYLRLLREITPYLRSRARRWHKDAWDIEDTVQDILLTLHAIRRTYDPSRPFGPWLVGIADRRAIDRLRRLGRTTRRETELDMEHEALAAPPETDVVLDRGRLEEAIGNLPPVQQKAVNLLKLGEMSLKDASLETGLSVASLKMATHRALQSLRAMLADRKDS
ncbi:sigma-70 family RNA polymerase sigma factor [Caulobacter sp. AP07]|uniref:sigma-70 family RNA polymerase sigma factor n=1 Tax=Caulobacter sp. AP07 TaxID=1144304 RepID=UPI0003093DF0|nr:sigma-70 family RNA polymerase sigma factor [Caulobacter sp. AP07]